VSQPPSPRSTPPRARYVAIVTDGNRRWAHARGLPVSDGYEAGADTLKARLQDSIEMGIEELTVYSFSTENWSRPAREINELISILTARIEREAPLLHEDGVRMRFIGRREDYPSELGALIDWAQSLTQDNRRITLCVAFNYGGRAEILDAAKRFQGGTEEDFRRCFYAPDLHDPDLILRTGGEQRLSNYLLWQAAYSELVFRDEMWPDFSRAAFEEAISLFETRARRFGGRAVDRPMEHPTGEHRLAPPIPTAADDRSPR
jgi:undecaprenyl diphosphate synthase